MEKKDYHWIYPIVVSIFVIGIVVFIGSKLFGGELAIYDGNMLSYATNVWTELVLGIGITYFIIGHFETKRQEDQKELERRIIQSNRITQLRLLENQRDKFILLGEMRDNDLLWKADLSHLDLRNMNLNDCNFSYARLIRTNISKNDCLGTNFSHAYMSHSILREARIYGAEFQYADLHYADFTNASLTNVSFENTNMTYSTLEGVSTEKTNFRQSDLRYGKFAVSKLYGADFTNAKLEGADVKNALWYNIDNVNELAILPDGSKYQLSLGIKQLDRFTNSNHPNFWQPN